MHNLELHVRGYGININLHKGLLQSRVLFIPATPAFAFKLKVDKEKDAE